MLLDDKIGLFNKKYIAYFEINPYLTKKLIKLKTEVKKDNYVTS